MIRTIVIAVMASIAFFASQPSIAGEIAQMPAQIDVLKTVNSDGSYTMSITKCIKGIDIDTGDQISHCEARVEHFNKAGKLKTHANQGGTSNYNSYMIHTRMGTSPDLNKGGSAMTGNTAAESGTTLDIETAIRQLKSQN